MTLCTSMCVLVLLSFLYMWCMQYLYCCALINASASPNFPPFSFCYLIISCLSQLSIFACMHQICHFRFKNWERGCLKEYRFFFNIFFQNHLLLRFEMIVIFFRGYFWKIKWYEGCASVVLTFVYRENYLSFKRKEMITSFRRHLYFL